MPAAAPKKLLTIVFLSAAVAFGGCGERGNSAAKNQAQAAQYYERAENYLQQGQYRSAIIEARNALKLAPQEHRNSVLLARAFNAIGQPKFAAQTLEPLAQTGDVDVAGVLVEAYLAQKKYQTALDYLQAHAAELHGAGNPELQLLQARALAGSGQFDAAKTILQLLEKNPAFANRAALEQARNAAAQGDSEGAMALVQRILQTAPKDPAALLFAARLAEQRNDLSQAEDLLGRALIELPQTDIVTPAKISVLETLTSVLTKLGRSNEALVYSKALADADPERMRLQEKLKQGMELFQSGKLAEAEPLLAEVYQQSKNDTAGMLLGIIKYTNNDLAGAAQYLAAHADPEVAPDAALLALAATDLRSAQPGKLLETFDPEQRARVKNPQLKTLLGIALLETGKTQEGERLIAQAQTDRPNDPAIAAALARHYLTSKQAPRALELLQKAQAAHPGDDTLNRLLIGVYLSLGDTGSALDSARKFAARPPEKAANLAVLGHTALLAKQFDVAATALQKALALQPDFAAAQFDLAQVDLLQKRPAAAAEIFAKMLQANPDNAPAIKGLITAHEMEHGRAATADSIEQWIPGFKTSATVRAVVAEYYVRNGRLDDAERLLQTIADAPDQRYANYARQLLAVARADQAAASRNFAEARNELMQALKGDATNTGLLVQLAQLELHANAPKEAEKIVARIEQLQPQSARVSELKADIASAEQRWADAAARYRTLWQQAPNDGIAAKLYQALQAQDAAGAAQFLNEWQTRLSNSVTPWLMQGMEAERRGDTAAAIRAYEAGLDRDADNVAALNNLALLYLQKGDKRALTSAEKAYRLQPKNPAVLDTYGWVQMKSGQRQAGLKLLMEAHNLAPQATEIEEHLHQAQL